MTISSSMNTSLLLGAGLRVRSRLEFNNRATGLSMILLTIALVVVSVSNAWAGAFSVRAFSPWAGYAIPNGLWLTGDINGDGKTDIVHAVQGTDYVHTWISNGNGTFTIGTFRPWAGYAIPNGIWMMADYDGDGKADIVHAVQSTDYAHVWLSDGSGRFTVLTFSPWTGYGIPNGLWLTADITGDRRSDIVHLVNRTDYVHPWLSTLPKPNEVALDGLEVTQAIQDMGHTVPLVADRATIVRAYLNFKSASPVTVRGVLEGRRSGGAWSSLNSINTVTIDPSRNWQLRPKREDISQSLNFRLPAAWISAGNLELQLSAVTESASVTPRTCSDCVTSPLSVNLQTSAPMHLRVLGLRYTTGTPPQTFAPRAIDFTLINSWLRRAYPIATLNSSSVTVNSTNAWSFGCGQANAQVAAARANDVNNGTDRRTHYYGLVDDGGGLMRGCASAIPNTPDPTAVASGPTGTNNWGWDNDGSYGDWYTGHELGHTYGRLHPGSGCGDSADDSNEPFPNGQLSGADGAFVGLDVGDATNNIAMAALPGVPWRDMMSYCQNQWISHYTYGGIRNRLTGETALPPGAPAPQAGITMTAGSIPTLSWVGENTIAMIGIHPNAEPRIKQSPTQLVTGSFERKHLNAAYDVPPDIVSGDKSPEAAGGVATVPSAEITPHYIEPPSVRRGFIATPSQVRAVAEPEVKLQKGDLLSVVATVNISRNTGKIQYVNRVAKGIAESPVGPEEAAVRFTDAAGNTVKSLSVILRRDTDVPPEEDQTGLIDAVVPFVTGAAKLEVVLFGKVVDSRTISKRAPRIRNLKVAQTPFARGVGAGPSMFSWEASDADNDQLTYTVLASADGGRTWQTVAFGLTEARFEIDPQAFGDVTIILLRVIANDGVNTAVITSRQPFRLR